LENNALSVQNTQLQCVDWCCVCESYTPGEIHANQLNSKLHTTFAQKVEGLTKLRSCMCFIMFHPFLQALDLRVQEASRLVQIIEQTN
jgi:hypothetical protein